MVVIIISAALTSYCLLLLVRKKHHQNTVVELVEHSQTLTCAFATQLFALLQVLLREPLCLHWLHKVEFHFSKASSAEVSRSAFQFCFYLNPGPLMFGRGVDRFGGHRHQRQLGKRVADCSSVAAGRLSHRTSLPVCVCAWGGGMLIRIQEILPSFLTGHGSFSAVWRRGSVNPVESSHL